MTWLDLKGHRFGGRGLVIKPLPYVLRVLCSIPGRNGDDALDFSLQKKGGDTNKHIFSSRVFPVVGGSWQGILMIPGLSRRPHIP